MKTLLNGCNERELKRILDFVPGILEEATDMHSFYKSQARVNNLYRRAKGITKTSYIDNYSDDFIEEVFTETREELDDIYYRITG